MAKKRNVTDDGLLALINRKKLPQLEASLAALRAENVRLKHEIRFNQLTNAWAAVVLFQDRLGRDLRDDDFDEWATMFYALGQVLRVHHLLPWVDDLLGREQKWNEPVAVELLKECCGRKTAVISTALKSLHESKRLGWSLDIDPQCDKDRSVLGWLHAFWNEFTKEFKEGFQTIPLRQKQIAKLMGKNDKDIWQQEKEGILESHSPDDLEFVRDENGDSRLVKTRRAQLRRWRYKDREKQWTLLAAVQADKFPDLGTEKNRAPKSKKPTPKR